MMRSVPVFGFAFLAAACDPPKKEPLEFDAGFHVDAGDFDAGPGCFAHPETVPGIVFGTGEVEFDETADGDLVPFYHGPQDGYHFYGAVREKDIDISDRAIVAFAVFDGDEQINDGLGVYARPATWTPAGDGWRATFGYIVWMKYIDGPEDVDGHSLCVVTRVTDASNVEYTDERTIQLSFDGDAL
jgi:hypothetical protein